VRIWIDDFPSLPFSLWQPNFFARWIISLPVDLSSDPELAQLEEKGVRGRYVSVERLLELPDGKVEWRMATSSTPGGNIPTFVAERSMPSKISDVSGLCPLPLLALAIFLLWAWLTLTCTCNLGCSTLLEMVPFRSGDSRHHGHRSYAHRHCTCPGAQCRLGTVSFLYRCAYDLFTTLNSIQGS
jgi:hypothetical protein